MKSTQDKVRISIVIPTFNRADLIDQTLQSVVSQTIKLFEILVIDNASTDNTAEIVTRYKKFGVKYVINPTNLGMPGNINRGIELAKGDYICILHSDDLISPDWHESFIKAIKTKMANIYTSSMCVIDIVNNPSYVFHTYPKDCYINRQEILPSLLNHYSPLLVPIGTTVYSKATLVEAGKLKENLTTEADADLSIKIILKSDLFYIRKVLFAYRQHANQTFDLVKEAKTETARLTKLNNYFNIVHSFVGDKKIKRTSQRLFILTHVFMSLCSINLYLVKLQFKKVIASNKIAFSVFPDLFTRPFDWFVFIKIQTMFVMRALFNRNQFKEDREKLGWLETIKH